MLPPVTIRPFPAMAVNATRPVEPPMVPLDVTYTVFVKVALGTPGSVVHAILTEYSPGTATKLLTAFPCTW